MLPKSADSGTVIGNSVWCPFLINHIIAAFEISGVHYGSLHMYRAHPFSVEEFGVGSTHTADDVAVKISLGSLTSAKSSITSRRRHRVNSWSTIFCSPPFISNRRSIPQSSTLPQSSDEEGDRDPFAESPTAEQKKKQ